METSGTALASTKSEVRRLTFDHNGVNERYEGGGGGVHPQR